MKKILCSLIYSCGLFLSMSVSAQNRSALETKYLNVAREIYVQSQDKLLVRDYETILITDESGKELGADGLRESNFRKLKKFEAEIKDIDGKRLAVLGKRDIRESTVSYSAIYNEHKTKYYHLTYPTLPYIISRKKEYEIASAFFWPDWDPQRSAEVEKASLTIFVDPEIEFDFLEAGEIGAPKIETENDGRKRYSWRVTDVPAYSYEYREAPEAAFEIGVRFTPKHFNLDGFVGASDTWRSFGRWFHQLYADRAVLESQPPIIQSIEKISDTREKIQTLYRYLQKKTRYVQIYLGIDGWRPHDVEDVHKALYGDCKDLSVYFIALLRNAGIQAWPALALTRDAGWVDADFPGNRFNHCIAVVPLPEDTLWVECTSDVNALDDLPASIEGINALLVTPEGGTLLRTPESPAEANRSHFSAVASLQNDRSLAVEGRAVWTGNLAINLRGRLGNLDLEEQKKWLIKRLSAASSDIAVEQFKFSGLHNPDSALTLNFEAKLAWFARKAGSRLIFQPGFFQKIFFDGETPEERTKALLNMTRFVLEASIRFNVPPNMRSSVAAKSDSVVSPFGAFRSSLEKNPDGAVWKSRFTSRARKVGLDAYEDYFYFMRSAKEKAEAKVVLRRGKIGGKQGTL